MVKASGHRQWLGAKRFVACLTLRSSFITRELYHVSHDRNTRRKCEVAVLPFLFGNPRSLTRWFRHGTILRITAGLESTSLTLSEAD
jgi:hypothetical protein